MKRCKRISPEHLRFLENKIKDFEADWLERKPKHYFRNIKNQGKSLLIDAEIVASSTKNFEEATCISNVRNVEAEAYIREVGNQRMRRRG
jgi:hypothetical protein